MKRIMAVTTLMTLLLCPVVAEARKHNHDSDPAGSSINAGCGPYGGQSLEINAADTKTILTLSIWGKGFEALQAGQRLIVTDLQESADSNGRATVCSAGSNPADCHYATVQLSLSAIDTRSGGNIEGTALVGSDTIKFSGKMPKPAQCN